MKDDLYSINPLDMTRDQAQERLRQIMPDTILKAYDHCTNNREELGKSKVAGCFCCLGIFSPNEIIDWTHECAICPVCNIDSVIGDASGYSVTGDFLREMNRYWFDGLGH